MEPFRSGEHRINIFRRRSNGQTQGSDVNRASDAKRNILQMEIDIVFSIPPDESVEAWDNRGCI